MCVALALSARSSLALDEDALWLPESHAKYYLDLKKAAGAAEALQRCDTILSGTIDLDESRRDHPVYRFLCRDPNRITYNELVDGLSFETLTTKVDKPVEITPDQLEAQRIAEEKRLIEEKRRLREEQWSQCELSWQEKVHLMEGVAVISDWPPPGNEHHTGAVIFTFDFDAISVDQAPLRYRARCQFLSSGEFSLRVKRRAGP